MILYIYTELYGSMLWHYLVSFLELFNTDRYYYGTIYVTVNI